ncbi:MAG: hypothetical protein JNK14_08875 [Chitinophagaceae bacterium]|nr:hypothetical protein [Chitinophagaceae bacterium]
MKKTRCLRPGLFIALFLSLCHHSKTQDAISQKYIDISAIRLVKSISKDVNSAYIQGKENLTSSDINSLSFSPEVIHKKTVPNSYVTQKAVLQFRLCNNSDSATGIYFFPGFYYRSIRLYKLDQGNLMEIPRKLPANPDSIGYRYIPLGPHDSATIFAELSFIRTYINTIRPRLISKEYINSYVTELHSTHNESELMTYIFCGLLLMMILYSIANFLQGANREFLYYSGYAFFIGTMLLTKAMFTYHTSYLSYFLEEYLDFIMQALGIMFYMAFMRKYLATRTNHPFLYKLYNAGILMLIVSIAGYTFFHYLTSNFIAENAIENITKVLLLLLTLIFLVYSIRHWKDKMMRYLFWGNLCLFVFALFSQAIIMNSNLTKPLPGILKSSLFYYELGLFLELVFFLMALNHKNRRQLIAQARERERLKAENQMKEYEKELAIFKAQQQERERISADIHDELGSGMTAIRLMSEIARNKMQGNVPSEIDKISLSADEVLNKMNAIIWSMNSGNDTIDNLVSYIRAYALEYFESTPIKCVVNTPDDILKKELSGDKRRNIFLCVKETLNNALKHSKGTQVTIDFAIDGYLIIKIADNGIGIDLKNIRQFANGLKNIARRMESIGGTFEIDSNHGTITILTLPI